MKDRSMMLSSTGFSCRCANAADELETKVVSAERREAAHRVRVEVELTVRGEAERPGGRVVRAGDHDVGRTLILRPTPMRLGGCGRSPK